MAPTIIIVSYRRPELLERCLRTVETYCSDWPVIVWDNASDASEEMRELSRQFAEMQWVFSPANLGFAAAVNRAAALSKGDLLLVNPDAELIADPLPLCRALDEDRKAAVVAPLVDDPHTADHLAAREWDNGRRFPGVVSSIIEYAGWSGRLRRLALSGRYSSFRTEVDWVSGACLLIRRTVWEQLHGFDESFWLYGEDVDFQKRSSQLGWRSLLYNDALVRHSAMGTASDDVVLTTRSEHHLRRNQAQFLRKHRGFAASAIFRAASGFLRRTQRSKRRIGVRA